MGIRIGIGKLLLGFGSGSSYWTPQLKASIIAGETFDNGKVVLQFDDAWDSVYDNGLPLFTAKGIKVTSWANGQIVTAHIVYHGASHDSYNMTWAQLRELKAAGHDIQCHGYTGTQISTLTDQQIADEYILNNSSFVANGLPSPEHTSYSNGTYNDHALTIVDNYRKTGRPGSRANYVLRDGSKHEMFVCSLTDGVAAVKAEMDFAKRNSVGLVIYGHMIGVTDALAISLADLTELIDYAQSLGLDFITISELYDLMYYIDITLSRECADDKINIICNSKLNHGESISIERSDDEGVNYAEVHVLAPGETDYSDAGLSANTNYYYRVRAFKGTTYYNYSRVDMMSTPVPWVLTATGTGGGVARMVLNVIKNMTVTLDGNGKFYSDAAGTLNEATSVALVRGVNTTLYMRCASGSSNMLFPSNNVRRLEAWVPAVNSPSLSFDIGKFTVLEYINVGTTANTISGNIDNLINMVYFDLRGTNTVGGSITKLTRLERLVATMTGANTLTGSITDLINLNYISIIGANTISGSIASLTNLTYFGVAGSNTITGSISNLIKLTQINNVSATNTLSGSINNLTLLTGLTVEGQNTISGDVTTHTNLVGVRVTGSNTLTGDFTNLISLTSIYVLGNNTLTGDFNIISNGLAYGCTLNPCRVVTYSAGGNWSAIPASGDIKVNPSVGYGLSSAEVDLFIQEVEATRAADRHLHIILQGSNAARTAASDAAVAAIVADGGAVTTNP